MDNMDIGDEDGDSGGSRTENPKFLACERKEAIGDPDVFVHQ
jgi:hypothetical protein